MKRPTGLYSWWRLTAVLVSVLLLMFVTGCSTGVVGSKSDYYKNDQVEGASLLAAETLTKWDANSGQRGDGRYVTDQGDPVVILQCVQAGPHVESIFVKKGHISGALVSVAHGPMGYVEDGRNDGMLVGAHDAPSGAWIDKYIQNFGITKDSVVVFTRDDETLAFCPTRNWWTFHYWGFARDRALMLDGGNTAWAAIEGNVLSNAPAAKATPSTFSVKELPKRRTDIRLSTGEMIQVVDSGKTPKGVANPIILDVRAQPQGWKNTGGFSYPLTPRPLAFDGVIKGAIMGMSPPPNGVPLPALYTPAGTFKSKAELSGMFAKNLGIDGSRPVIIYCNTGALASLYSYVLQEIVGFNNVVMYDAGWTQWESMTAWEPTMAAIDYVRDDFLSLFDGLLEPNDGFLTKSRFFRWDGSKFVDVVTNAEVKGIVPGGHMKGNVRWDTLTRSDYVAFRPTAKANDPARNKTYHAPGSNWAGTDQGVHVLDQDWPKAITFPEYSGKGNQIFAEDSSY